MDANYYDNEVPLNELVGRTISQITGLETESEEVHIHTKCGREYVVVHLKQCCEEVCLIDFTGDAQDLVGAVILSAEACSNTDGDLEDQYGGRREETWTFYKIETTKGGIWMRWFGSSNGFYSTEVNFVWANNPAKPKARDELDVFFQALGVQ